MFHVKRFFYLVLRKITMFHMKHFSSLLNPARCVL